MIGTGRVHLRRRLLCGTQCPGGWLLRVQRNEKKHHSQSSCVPKNSVLRAPPGARTLDTLIKSQVLYQLS